MKEQVIMTVITVLVLSSCDNKNENKSLAPIKVKTKTISLTPINGTQIEEINGTALSFSIARSIKRIYVSFCAHT